MKIAILNDTHAGVRNSSDIFSNNAEDFYSKIFFPYCVDNHIKQIIHLGDYYDNRNVLSVKMLYRNRKMFLEPLRKNGMMMDIILGNHDVTFKNTNEINSLKEALGFFMNEIHIIMEPKVLKYGQTNIAMLPWINSSNYEHSMNFVKNCSAHILCGHLELNGFELMKGVVNTHGMDPDIFSRFELVLTGHFHTRSSKNNIHYLGSQLEFAWSDAHDPKYFHVLDTDTRILTKVLNPHTLFEKIVYNDSNFDYSNFDLSRLDNKFVKVIVVEKKDTYKFDKFIDKIQQQKILELKIAENFSEFLGVNVDMAEGIEIEDTQHLLASYIEAVDTDLDKERIKKEMNTLLLAAQAMELS